MKKTNSTDTPKAKKVPVLISLKNTLLIALTSVLVGVFLTLGYFLYQQNNQLSTQTDLSDVDRVYQQLKETYYKDVSDKTLKNGAISGMLSALGDPYSQNLEGGQAEQVNQTIQGNNFGGIGVQVIRKNQQVVIDALVPDTPAQKANLKVGDIIKAVDDKQIEAGDITKASELIRGKVGTIVNLTVIRANKELKVQVKRAMISQSTVSEKHLNPTTSMVQITQFDTNTARDLKKVLKRLEKEGLTKVILDVRGNPGGIMNSAIQSASYFVAPKKVIMQYQEKNKKPVKFKSTEELNKGYQTKLKAVVLIDGNSASAAEIFAAALNQSANVPLIGQKSFGKGTVQEVNTVKGVSEYKYTVAKWLTPDGTWVNKKGLKPTKEIPVPEYLNTSGFSSMQPLKAGMTGLDIVTLQKMLQTFGFLKAPVTGVFDDATVKAVKIFQKNNHLPETGIVDARNQNLLYEALVNKAIKEDKTIPTAEAELNQMK